MEATNIVSGLDALIEVTKKLGIKQRFITKMVITLECNEVALAEVTSYLDSDGLKQITKRYNLIEEQDGTDNQSNQ